MWPGSSFDGLLQVLDGLAAVALGEEAAGHLEVILGAVAGLVLELVEDGAGLVQIALLAIDAGPLQLHLVGVVAGLLGLFESLEGLVEFVARDQGRPR